MGAEPAPRALLSLALSSCAASPPLRGRDLLRLGGLVALAVVTLAPVHHHVGSQGRVRATKLEPDSFPLFTYLMFSEDRRGRVIVPNTVGFTAEGEGVMPHCTHFGADGLDQVRKQTARPVRAGRAGPIGWHRAMRTPWPRHAAPPPLAAAPRRPAAVGAARRGASTSRSCATARPEGPVQLRREPLRDWPMPR